MESTEVIATNWSRITVEDYLSQLSLEAFRNRIPVVLYIVLIIVLGLVGNVLVIVVYWFRFKPCATRVFVLAMAACDLITNTVGLPLRIFTIRYAYDMFDYWTCRSFFASITLSTQASGLLLVLVAVDRYRRICRPFQAQLNAGKAFILVIGAVCLSAILFAPFIPLYGRQVVNTTIPGIQTSICWLEDEYKHTSYIVAYKTAVGITFFGGLFTMTSAYFMIALRIWKQRRERLISKKKTSHNDGCSNDPKHVISSITKDSPGQETVLLVLDCRSYKYPLKQAEMSAVSKTLHVGMSQLIGLQYPTSPFSDSADTDLDNTLEITACSSDAHKLDAIEISVELPDEADGPQANAGHEISGKANASPTNPATAQAQAFNDPQDACEDVCVTEADNTVSKTAAKESPVSQRFKGEMAMQDSKHVQKTRTSSRQPQRRLTRKGPLASSRTRRMRSRTTLMMSVLTLFYVINWLPHLVMRYTRKDAVNLCPNFTDCDLDSNLYALAIRSYYLNSAVNAFVYGFCNARFRQELMELLTYTLMRKRQC